MPATPEGSVRFRKRRKRGKSKRLEKARKLLKIAAIVVGLLLISFIIYLINSMEYM